MAKEKDFSVKDSAQIVEVAVRTLQFYVEKLLIHPDTPAWGKGSRRKFSKRNLVEVLVLKELQNHGFQLDQIRKVMDELRKVKLGDYFPLDPDSPIYDEAPTLFLVVFDRHDVIFHWGDKEGDLKLPMKDYITVTAINLATLREKIQQV